MTSPLFDQSSVLGEVRTLADLLGLLRRRKDELNTTFECIDAIAGLPARYSAKVLNSRSPQRGLGPLSFDGLLGAMGIKLVAVTDPEAMARIAGRITPRRYRQPRRVSEPEAA